MFFNLGWEALQYELSKTMPSEGIVSLAIAAVGEIGQM